MAENNLIDNPIVGENGFVDTAFGAIGGLNPVFGNLYAGLKGANAMKQKDRNIQDFSSNLETWNDTERNKDYLQSNVASNVLTKIGEKMRQNNNLAQQQQAVTGATDESVLAAKANANKAFNETAGNIAAMGTARQDQVESRYMNQNMGILDRENQVQDQKVAAAQTMQKNNEETMNSVLSAMTGGMGGAATQAVGNTPMQVMGGQTTNQFFDQGVADLQAPQATNLGAWNTHGFDVSTQNPSFIDDLLPIPII